MWGAWLCKEPLNFSTSSLTSNHSGNWNSLSGHFRDYYKLLLSSCFSGLKHLKFSPLPLKKANISIIITCLHTAWWGWPFFFSGSIALSLDLPKIWDVRFVIWTSRSQRIQLNNSDEAKPQIWAMTFTSSFNYIV